MYYIGLGGKSFNQKQLEDFRETLNKTMVYLPEKYARN